MSDAGQPTSVRKLIRNPQDFYGGLVLAAFALFTLWAGSDLPGMRGFAFGPGTAPRLFGVLLLGVSIGIAALALISDGPPLEKWGVRGPVLFIASVIFFAATIRPLGLIIASFGSLVIAAAASKESRLVETVIWSAVLTVFCVLLFVYALKLPLQLWPRF
jgi:putative tricarboxylic transport membrane protein